MPHSSEGVYIRDVTLINIANEDYLAPEVVNMDKMELLAVPAR
jgi:hypothetical protein